MGPSDGRVGRGVIRAVLLAMAVAASALAAWLLVTGGGTVRIFGVNISAHEPRRPLLYAAIAFTAWILTTSGVRASGLSLLIRRLRFLIDDRVLVGMLAIVTVFIGIRYGTMVGGGADSYGYVSQTDLWLRGQLVTPQPWADAVPWPDGPHTFAPLGYRVSPDRQGIVPSYPPGLPLLMAGASAIGGFCARFWVAPLSGALIVITTFLLGRRLSSARAGLIAAVLVASSPIFLSYAMQPMSDVPVSAAWATAMLLLHRSTTWSSAGAGLAAGIALLIRPNLSPFALLLPMWIAGRAVWAADAAARWQRVWHLGAYLGGLAVGVVVLALFNDKMYGGPFRSGYGEVSQMFALANVLPNLRNYPTWFAEMQTPLPLVGLGALLVPWVARWPAATDRSFLVLFGAFGALVFVQYCFYFVFDAWWYTRFLLPCWPVIMIGFGHLLASLGRIAWGTALLATVVVAGLAVHGVSKAIEEHTFEMAQGERRYVAVARLVREMTPANSVVLAMQHSGTIRLYGGRMTLSHHMLSDRHLDQVVTYLAEHGAHPFVLLEDWEYPHFIKKFASAKAVSLLERAPVLTYQSSGTTNLYDLGASAPPRRSR